VKSNTRKIAGINAATVKAVNRLDRNMMLRLGYQVVRSRSAPLERIEIVRGIA
jgi:hypothetical protein